MEGGRKWSILLGWNELRKALGGGDLKQCLKNSRDIFQVEEVNLVEKPDVPLNVGSRVGKGDIVWCVCNCGFQSEVLHREINSTGKVGWKAGPDQY